MYYNHIEACHMFSKILIKLIDQAIVPAVFLLAVKIISTILVGKYLNIDYTFGPTGFVYGSVQDYVLVNSYSTFAMVAALAVGLFYVLLKSLVFHDTHITPRLTAKLFSLRLSNFMQSSFDLYSQGAIWMSYSYLLLVISAIMAAFEMILPWVFYSSLVLTVISTILFILDVENEMSIRAESHGITNDEDIILQFEE